MTDLVESSSFRDPSGFLFTHNHRIYRRINYSYSEQYNRLMKSGLYEKLTADNLLIPHTETNIESKYSDGAYKILVPEPISFISYPYEWCFSQLKDAALTTLRIQKTALEYDMILKDSSAYNIQFHNGKPLLIDTLSFEIYREGYPWVAYRQFCQHFLAPLTLMALKDVRLNQMLQIYIDGMPLDLASKLLPISSWMQFASISHIHLHAKTQRYYQSKSPNRQKYKMKRLSLLGLMDNLETAVKKLKWKPSGTEWSKYYDDINYSSDAFNEKVEIIQMYLNKVSPRNVWDLGGNIGLFSRLASNIGIPTISLDNDPAAVELNYQQTVRDKEINILPLLIDLTNPSSGIGWQNNERVSLNDRGPADTVMALALIHHLCISNNVPFNQLAEFFRSLCSTLIIEFIPKIDSQVQRLLKTRDDIFTGYTEMNFREEFEKLFNIVDRSSINESDRSLYLLKAKK